ncbi:MAG: hypothetical protein L0G06_08805, partial [Enterobacterales bacterium]|nr:hypothetical protein [Enterobacterales bacterium]
MKRDDLSGLVKGLSAWGLRTLCPVSLEDEIKMTRIFQEHALAQNNFWNVVLIWLTINSPQRTLSLINLSVQVHDYVQKNCRDWRMH